MQVVTRSGSVFLREGAQGVLIWNVKNRKKLVSRWAISVPSSIKHNQNQDGAIQPTRHKVMYSHLWRICSRLPYCFLLCEIVDVGWCKCRPSVHEAFSFLVNLSTEKKPFQKSLSTYSLHPTPIIRTKFVMHRNIRCDWNLPFTSFIDKIPMHIISHERGQVGKLTGSGRIRRRDIHVQNANDLSANVGP